MAALNSLPELPQPVPYRARLVLTWITFRFFDDGRPLVFSHAKFARELHIPEQRLREALAELRAAGLVDWERGGGRAGQANRYWLPWFEPAGVARKSGDSKAASVAGKFGDSESPGFRSRVAGFSDPEPPGNPASKDTKDNKDPPSLRSGETRTKAKGSRRCPPDWLPPPEFEAWFQANTTLTRDQVNAELARFHDHEFATPKRDWVATFRNWLRKAEEYQRSRPGRSESVADHLSRAVTEAMR